MSSETSSRRRFLADVGTLALVVGVCKEYLRRKNHPGDQYIPDDNPLANQEGFHKSLARTRLLFGGNQSGKSRAAAQEIKWWLEGSHPYRTTPSQPKIYVISADYRTLSEGVYRHLLGDPGGKVPAILHEWEIIRYGTNIPSTSMPSWIMHKDGGVVNFISGEGGEKARKKVQAAAVNLIGIDEEIPGDMWQELMARRLTYGGEVMVTATLIRSEEWLVDLEDKAEEGDPNIDLFRLDTKRAVERGHIDKLAYEDMEAMLTEEDIHVRLRGGSRKRQGLVYADFGKHHVVDMVDPLTFPEHWTRYCSIDPGRRTCAVLWAAVAPDQKIHVYREGYFHGRTYHDLAKFIYQVEGWVQEEGENQWMPGRAAELIHTRWIDPHAFDHAVSGQPGVGTLLASDYQIQTSPAPNAVHFGIEKVHQALMMGMDMTPGLVVSRGCPALIREFRTYKWVDDRGSSYSHERQDTPIKRNDHALDALRYMIAGGCRYDASNKKWKQLKAKIDRQRDIDSLGSSGLKDRMETWWAIREKEGMAKRREGSYIGGIGTESR